MVISVSDAVARLEARQLVRRRTHDQSDRIIQRARELLGDRFSSDLMDFYRANLDSVGDYKSIMPLWNDRVGWRDTDRRMLELLSVQAVPLFGDGSGNLFGLDLEFSQPSRAVYLFDHEIGFAKPEYAAGSSLGMFLLVLGDTDRAFEEGWPPRWELGIDPDIDKCPRAPPPWNAS